MSADTGLQSPTSTGSPNNDWTDPDWAYTSDDQDAKGKQQADMQDYGGFDFAIPNGATIDGIEVVVEWAGNNAQLTRMGVELSWNGGAIYTLTGYSDTRESKTDSDSTFGGASDKWGRPSWFTTELTTNNFRLRLAAVDTQPHIEVDWVRAKVYYTIVPPVVNNDGGASNVSITAAILNGEVTAGTPTPSAYVYWGPTDGVTNKTAWSNSIGMGAQGGYFSTNVALDSIASKTYYYRCYATNAADDAWALSSTNFTTPVSVLSFTNTPYEVLESGTSQVITVTISTESALDVSVAYATSNGTAEANGDYTNTSGTLIWTAGQTGSKTFTIPIVDDGDDESDETIDVYLYNSTNCTITGGNPVTVVISDNDGYATVQFAVTNSSGSELIASTSLVVTCAPAAPAGLSVDYAVVGGTASNGFDYILTAGTLQFSAGQTTTNISMTVTNDLVYEENETVIVALSNPSNCVLGLKTNHTYTILDSDAKAPQVGNAGGAYELTSSSATLRGEVIDTGREDPAVFFLWGMDDGGTNRSAWSNSVPMGTSGIGSLSTNITGLTSNTLYYYRCYATNTGGEGWAAWTEAYFAADPPSLLAITNTSFEIAGASADDAAHWGRSDAVNVQRVGARARTGSYSMNFDIAPGIYAYGVTNNYFRVSWHGYFANGESHPDGIFRPGYVLSGSAYVRAKTPNRDATQFTYRWRNVDDGVNWMSGSVFTNGIAYREISISNPDGVPPADVNDRFRPELVRDTGDTGQPTEWHGDDLSISVSLPRLYLQRSPTQTFVYADTVLGTYTDAAFGVKNAGGGEGTVLYGAYITDVADLTNASWGRTAWYELDDPSNAFSIASGASVSATNDAGWQYATIRFTPLSVGTFTGIVRVATTDPGDYYSGGGRIHNTIVYEEYTLVATANQSAESDIAFVASDMIDIPYEEYQATNITGGDNAVLVGIFNLRDGGSDLFDDDPFDTTLTEISFSVINHPYVRRVALYESDGTTEIAEGDGGATVTFTGLDFTATDAEHIRQFYLYATFKSVVADNALVKFTVSSATAELEGSQFAQPDAGGAATPNDYNRIEVEATKLAFSSVPSSVDVPDTFSLLVLARDDFNMLDQDATDSVTLSKVSGDGVLSSDDGLTQSLSGGWKQWTDLWINASGDFTIRAGAAGLTAVTSSVIEARIYQESFESTGGYTVSNEFGLLDTDAAYFKRGQDGDFEMATTMTNEDGTYYFGGENTDQSPGTGASGVTLTNLNVASYGHFAIRIAAAANESGNNYESSDYILVQTRFDGGTWVTNGAFRGDGTSRMKEDTDLDGVGDGAALSNAFQNFEFEVAEEGDSLQVRVLFYMSEDGEEAGFDNIRVLGDLIDRSSTVNAPGTQVAAATISSLSDTPAEAQNVFRFTVSDPGSTDRHPTRVTQVTVKPGAGNTADWTDTIQGVGLDDGSTVAIGTPTITDTSLTIPITVGNLDVSDAATKDVTLSVYLNTNSIVEGSVLQFMVDADDSGFTADVTGSRFSGDFGSDVVSSNFTIGVIATELQFGSGKPSSAVGVNVDFSVQVKSTDENGNTDIDSTASVTLSKVSGAGALSSASGLTQSLVSGIKLWTDVKYSVPGLFSIRAGTTGLTDVDTDYIRAGGVWINEFDYDNPGTDSNEWVELVGPVGLSLDDYELVVIDQNGAVDSTHALVGADWTFTDETNGFGFCVIGVVAPNEGAADYTPAGWTQDMLQNGPTDSIQLRIASSGGSIHLVDYEGNNPNTYDDQNTALADSNSSTNTSLFLTGETGTWYSVFYWTNTQYEATPGAINFGQGLSAFPKVAPSIVNFGATGVTSSRATLRGRLVGGFPSPRVIIYWGQTDGGQQKSAWSGQVDMAAPWWGPFATNMWPLDAGTKHYFRCYASNSENQVWADSTTNFTTLSVDPVDSRHAVYIDNVGIGTTMPLNSDLDEDGLADSWELQYLGSTAVSGGGASADKDSDGWLDWQEYVAGTHPDRADSYMRISGGSLRNSASQDVMLRVAGGNFWGSSPYSAAGDSVTRIYTVYAADNYVTNAKTLVSGTTDDLSGTNSWYDIGAADTYDRRYYNISVSLGGVAYTNTEEWAMYAEDRPADRRFLICVPVNYAVGGSNNLNSTLGEQLGFGLHAGDAGSTNTADRIQYWDQDGNWKEYLLVTNASGNAYWWDPESGGAANVTFTPGMAVWVVRGAETATRSNAVFVGKSFLAAETVNFTFKTDGWTMFGWPLARERAHVNEGGSTASNQLGFFSVGTGGTHPEAQSKKGDQIWIWEDNTWQYYWLMDSHYPGGSEYDGKWWNSHSGTFADFSFEPGSGYYYYHPTNWAAMNFVWRPEAP